MYRPRGRVRIHPHTRPPFRVKTHGHPARHTARRHSYSVPIVKNCLVLIWRPRLAASLSDVYAHRCTGIQEVLEISALVLCSLRSQSFAL